MCEYLLVLVHQETLFCAQSDHHILRAHDGAVSTSAQGVTPDRRDECRLEGRPVSTTNSSEELAVTNEQLRLTEEEVLILRRRLDQSRETIWEMENHTRRLEHQLGKCQIKVREAQDARRDNRIKFVGVLGLLSLRHIELESLIDEVRSSQFKCSQVTFLSAALQERVTDLEAEVKSLKGARKGFTPLPIRARTDACLFQATDTGMDVV